MLGRRWMVLQQPRERIGFVCAVVLAVLCACAPLSGTLWPDWPALEWLLRSLPVVGIGLTLWAIASLARTQRIVHEAMDGAQAAIAIYDADDKFILGNRPYNSVLDLEFAPPHPGEHYRDVLRRSLSATPEDEREREVERRYQVHKMADGTPSDRRYPDGRWMRVTKTRLPSGANVGVAVDVTDYYSLKAQLECEASRFSALAENAPVGICQVGAGGRVTFLNRALATMLGVPGPEAVSGASVSFVMGETTLSGFDALLAALANAPEAAEVTMNGSVERHFIVSRASLAAADMADETFAQHRLYLFVDITERKEAEARVAIMATHDALTGAKNRVAFNSNLAAVANRASHKTPVCLIAIDLDRFKPVNDRYGHATGDALLRAVVKRVTSRLPETMSLYRVGGDEFAILAFDTPHDACVAFGRRLVDAIARPFTVSGVTLSIGASIGVSTLPKDTRCPDTLVDYADRALYHVKRSGGLNARAFDPSLLNTQDGPKDGECGGVAGAFDPRAAAAPASY